jgi:hypothetical protein
LPDRRDHPDDKTIRPLRSLHQETLSHPFPHPRRV